MNRVNAMPGNIREISNAVKKDRQSVPGKRKDIPGYC